MSRLNELQEELRLLLMKYSDVVIVAFAQEFDVGEQVTHGPVKYFGNREGCEAILNDELLKFISRQNRTRKMRRRN